MNVYEIILKKRNGGELSTEEITAVISGLVRGEVPDYQMASLLMAIYFRGMNDRETADLTRAMMESGETIAPESLGRLTADKHSTGGVGDKVSIPLAPLVAACGVRVPMMSGRGLGHTGGTLDKLESIPGFQVQLEMDRFRAVLEDVGAAIIGQTERLVPADRIMYALRDVTATVDSIPLIASSIMSKKLAAGPRCLVLDVKTGRGAFMRELEQARELARRMVAIGRRLGRSMAAVISAMDQPLGRKVGNALEIEESIACLRGEGPEDLEDLVRLLGGLMLALAGVAADPDEGARRIGEALTSGAGLERFRRMVEAQGGDPRVVDDPGLLPHAPERTVITADRSGWVAELDALEIGLACVELGAGRRKVEDRVDHRVGVVLGCKVGDRVERGDPLLEVHHASGAEAAIARLRRAVKITAEPAHAGPLVHEVMVPGEA